MKNLYIIALLSSSMVLYFINLYLLRQLKPKVSKESESKKTEVLPYKLSDFILKQAKSI